MKDMREPSSTTRPRLSTRWSIAAAVTRQAPSRLTSSICRTCSLGGSPGAGRAADARVVHEHVEPAEPLRGRRDRARDRLVVGDVARDHLVAVRLEVEADDGPAAPAQLGAERRAEGAARAGHERPPAHAAARARPSSSSRPSSCMKRSKSTRMAGPAVLAPARERVPVPALAVAPLLGGGRQAPLAGQVLGQDLRLALDDRERRPGGLHQADEEEVGAVEVEDPLVERKLASGRARSATRRGTASTPGSPCTRRSRPPAPRCRR